MYIAWSAAAIKRRRRVHKCGVPHVPCSRLDSHRTPPTALHHDRLPISPRSPAVRVSDYPHRPARLHASSSSRTGCLAQRLISKTNDNKTAAGTRAAACCGSPRCGTDSRSGSGGSGYGCCWVLLRAPSPVSGSPSAYALRGDREPGLRRCLQEL